MTQLIKYFDTLVAKFGTQLVSSPDVHRFGQHLLREGRISLNLYGKIREGSPQYSKFKPQSGFTLYGHDTETVTICRQFMQETHNRPR